MISKRIPKPGIIGHQIRHSLLLHIVAWLCFAMLFFVFGSIRIRYKLQTFSKIMDYWNSYFSSKSCNKALISVFGNVSNKLLATNKVLEKLYIIDYLRLSAFWTHRFWKLVLWPLFVIPSVGPSVCEIFFGFCPKQILLIFCMSLEYNRVHHLSQIIFLKRFLVRLMRDWVLCLNNLFLTFLSFSPKRL